jgi:hypothetical protein
MGIADAPKQ